MASNELVCANCGAKFIAGQRTCSECGGGLVVFFDSPKPAPCGRCKSPAQPVTGECSSCGVALPYANTPITRADQAREDLKDAKKKAFQSFQDIRRSKEARHARYKQAALRVLVWLGKAFIFMTIILFALIFSLIFSDDKRKEKSF